ncbi:hypothetical protein SDJN03_09473, partial [Cucurbita argyrosperma subsp. sororia]
MNILVALDEMTFVLQSRRATISIDSMLLSLQQMTIENRLLRSLHQPSFASKSFNLQGSSCEVKSISATVK